MTADAHARFQVGLSAHLAGVLPPEETAWMETHAGECADCKSLLGRGQAVFERLGASGVHIPARMLSSFLLEPNDLTPLERELVGRHLESCADCRQDMEEMARAAGVPPRLKAPGASGGGWGGVGAVLAAAAVVAAIVVWRQARHPPPAAPAPPIAAIPAPTPEAALGGAPLLVLQERVRGATRPAPASDTIGFGQRVVRIQLPALFVQRDSRLLITATTAAGVEVARDTLPTEALDRPFELTVTLGPWRAGDYVLKVIPAAGRDTTATRVFEFKLLLSP